MYSYDFHNRRLSIRKQKTWIFLCKVKYIIHQNPYQTLLNSLFLFITEYTHMRSSKVNIYTTLTPNRNSFEIKTRKIYLTICYCLSVVIIGNYPFLICFFKLGVQNKSSHENKTAPKKVLSWLMVTAVFDVITFSRSMSPFSKYCKPIILHVFSFELKKTEMSLCS